MNNLISNIDIANHSTHLTLSELNREVKDINNDEHLSLIALNIRSARKIFNLFQSFLNSIQFNFDIIVLSETWLQTSVNVKLEGYLSESAFRNNYGGGITILYRDYLNIKSIDQLNLVNNTAESLFIEIQLNRYNLIIGAFYRPPSNIVEFTDLLKDKYLPYILNKKVILIGDFNINLLSNVTVTSCFNFVQVMSESGLIPMITTATRVTPYGQSLIDHLWTNMQNIVFSATIETNISDHYPIIGIFKISNLKKFKEIKYRKYSELRLNQFKGEFSNYANNYTITSNSSNTLMSDFIFILKSLINKHFPIKHKKLKYKCLRSPSISEDLIAFINKKHKIFRLYKLDLISFAKFRSYRNILTNALKSAKKSTF